MSLSTSAQTTTILDRFRASEIDGKVLLEWVISSGSTCNGIRIYRSTDSLNFNLIGSILGECGSLSEPVLYTFVDSLPIPNSKNYYQLELGGNGTSEIVSIEFIDTREKGYQLRPHPFSDTGNIFFQNSEVATCQLRIYTMAGIEIYRAVTHQNFFTLSTSHYPSGIYAFTILCDGGRERISGQVMIQH